jgi:hypothetical protein
MKIEINKEDSVFLITVLTEKASDLGDDISEVYNGFKCFKLTGRGFDEVERDRRMLEINAEIKKCQEIIEKLKVITE